MDLHGFGLSAIGVFYVAAGAIAARAVLVTLLLDRTLAALSGSRLGRAESIAATWLLAASNVILAGGAALALQLRVALPLFLISAAGQAIYLLLLAPLYLDKHDPPEGTGRQRTVFAALVYLAATGLVVWAAGAGLLRPWQEAPPELLALAATGVIVHAAYTAWRAVSICRSAGALPPFDSAQIEPSPPRSDDQ